MTISSRTPEGLPNRCPVCGKRLRLSPSWPSADAPCPHCGSLVWFPGAKPRRRSRKKERQDSAQPAAANVFTIDDFRKQFDMMARMGGMRELIGQMPGLGDMLPEWEDPEVAIRRIRGIIDAMSKEEKRNPDIIEASRRRRIAVGSGVSPQEIGQFVEQFNQVRTLMERMSRMSIWQRLKMVMGFGGPGRLIDG